MVFILVEVLDISPPTRPLLWLFLLIVIFVVVFIILKAGLVPLRLVGAKTFLEGRFVLLILSPLQLLLGRLASLDVFVL